MAKKNVVQYGKSNCDPKPPKSQNWLQKLFYEIVTQNYLPDFRLLQSLHSI